MSPTPTGNDRFNAEAAAWDSNPDVHRASDGALQAILAAYPSIRQTKANGKTETEGLDILEIGCGTGLLSLRMAPYVRSILAIDAAGGMIDALSVKLENMQGQEGETARRVVTPLCVLLEDPEDLRLPAASSGVDGDGDGDNDYKEDSNIKRRKKFDLVTSHLVLHHIPDLKPLLLTMYGCLKPGGQVALTDFEDFGPEARKFHPEAKMLGVERHGIKAEWFAGLMREAGFEDVDVKPAWTMEKEVERFPGEWGHKRPEGGDGVELEKMEFPFLLCRGTRKA
ncbi:hypothetical protein VP1G_06979 [Cytospora mali]|uniref:S-adenosyl-L-methionine-dependent methyltransferase n=1 Tax=Cytospora mali TaxID=578113 RepID=A0A194V6V1_CYTMA|nr:hypothetical protein VP1G_06979 [Valsa mali var. pyri (nom. inval.)]